MGHLAASPRRHDPRDLYGAGRHQTGREVGGQQRCQYRPPGGGRGDFRPGDRRCPDRRRVDHRPTVRWCRVQQRHDAAGGVVPLLDPTPTNSGTMINAAPLRTPAITRPKIAPTASRWPVLAPLLATDFAPSLMPTSTMQIARTLAPRICNEVPHCATQALT